MAQQQLTNHVASDAASELGRIQFLVRSMLAGLRTSIPVEVVSVTNAGSVSPIGRVSVRPLIGVLDGNGNLLQHGVVENVPYLRLQGGPNAVILDPEPGDIGVGVVCDRDISSVKSSGASAAPGSLRKFDLSDMVYLMTAIGSAPTQYVQFTATGINVVSPNNVAVTAGGDATVTATGSATIKAASAVVQAASIALQNSGAALLKLLNSAFSTWAAGHVHSNGNGGADTGTPTTSPPAAGQTSVVSAE